MLYVYPAIVHEDPDGLWAEFPDLPGCQTFDDSIDGLLAGAAEALECYLVEALEQGEAIAPPSRMKDLHPEGDAYATLIRIDVDLAKNTRSVKKTLTIPAWLNDKALAKGINFSKVLQEALVAKVV